MSSAALVKLSALLEAQGLPALRGVAAPGALAPPSQKVLALETLAEHIAQAQAQAQARLSQAQARVRTLAAMGPTQSEVLAARSGLDIVKLAALALEELDRATAHHQAVLQSERRREAALVKALEERAEAVAHFRAAWKLRNAGPPLSAGLGQSLGPAIEDALHAAIDQLMDRTIAAEQTSGADLWQHKDRLDLAREESAGLARLAPQEGMALISETLVTLEQVSAAISRPSSDQRDRQEEHNKAPE